MWSDLFSLISLIQSSGIYYMVLRLLHGSNFVDGEQVTGSWRVLQMVLGELAPFALH